MQAGLNLEIKCQNSNCSLYNQLSYISMGFPEDVDMSKVCCETYCPACNSQIDFETINVLHLKSCSYSIDAMDSLEKRIIEKSKDDTSINFNNWYFLILNVYPLTRFD